MKVEY